MKKFIIPLVCGVMAVSGIKAADYTVYDNGVLGAGLIVYGWWNASMDFKAANPDGEGMVFEFKAADGGAAASAGLNMEAPENTGKLHDATLNFNWYATTSATYTIRLTSVTEENYTFTPTADELNKWNTTSLSVAETFPKVSQEWNDDKKLGVGYVFSVILENGTSSSVIYFDDVYYSNVDESWTAPEHEIVGPASVPVPDHAAADVLSVFSSGYIPATSFGIGYWGQSTSANPSEIAGSEVYYLQNFNYLGWELSSDLDVSAYDYMHVDFWPCDPTGFGFTPISRGPKELGYVATSVTPQEWNSYDVPLSYWENVVDLAALFQIKFDNGSGVDAYIANVYFWKDSNNPGGGDQPGGNEPSDAGVTSATMTNCWIDGTPESERIDLEVKLNYTVTYGEDKKLVIEIVPEEDQFNKVVGIVPQLFIDGAYAGNFTIPAPYIYTTETTYEVGDKVKMNFYCAYNGGSAAFPEFTYTVTSSPITGVGTVADESLVDVYTISGVRVAKSVDFNSVKSSLSPGLYIVGTKKVLVK